MSVINLREYMKRVYTELENYIEGLSEEERVRFVTEFHDMFDSGTADYDDEHITALYVMKYARAYGFQFSRAYADIFADMNNPESIKAVSIGCGTGIDYWGMSYAARVLGEAPESKLNYTGIDPVCWPYRITEAADMPEQDMVRYNEIVSDKHNANGERHSGLFHEAADEIKSCTDFNEYLGYMENRPREPLSDIYFFPHSTKEVCIHTVPNEVEDRSLYNTYQAMSRFAHIIHSRIKDKPVYVAFTYRQVPTDDGVCREQNESYDIRYGTYLRTCLIERGMNVELLQPMHCEQRYGHDLEICESPESNRGCYFTYDEFHSYVGAPDTPDKIWLFGRDDDDSFDSMFYGSKKICDRDRWNELTNVSDKIHNYPMDSTNGICYQVFKITRGNADNRELTDKNLVLDILEETMRGFTFWSGFSQDIYKFAKNMYMYPWTVHEKAIKLIADTTGYVPDSVRGLQEVFSIDNIFKGLIADGCIEQFEEADGRLRYGITPNGENCGLYDKDGRIMAKSFARRMIFANMICGRYVKFEGIKKQITMEDTRGILKL